MATNSGVTEEAAAAYEQMDACKVDVMATLRENRLGMRWDEDSGCWLVIENGQETAMHKDAPFSVFAYLHSTHREAVIITAGEKDGASGNW